MLISTDPLDSFGSKIPSLLRSFRLTVVPILRRSILTAEFLCIQLALALPLRFFVARKTLLEFVGRKTPNGLESSTAEAPNVRTCGCGLFLRRKQNGQKNMEKGV